MSSTVRDATFMSMEKGSGFVLEYRFAAGPVYAKGQPRRNIFFSQVIKAPIGSNFHQEHGRQTVMPLADISVFIAALSEEAVYPLLDHLNLYGLSCFHRRPLYQSLRDLQALFVNILNIFQGHFREIGIAAAPHYLVCFCTGNKSRESFPLLDKCFYFI